MELNAALAADLSILNEALDDANVDLVQSLQQLVPAAKRAVAYYLGLSITATTRVRQINLTALDDHGVAAGIRTSLRVLLGAAVSPPAGADRDGAITRSVPDVSDCPVRRCNRLLT